MSIQKVIKRNGSEVAYNPEKIHIAIQKANKEVPEAEQASELVIEEVIRALEAAKKGRFQLRKFRILLKCN